ncbi:carbohydrate-binding domain-containing protein [Agathobaculum butyriciproducens]|uniref:Carbohydrate-binding domain-containing protein n=1 Tax=Agathobaculum butyriciproducens TaxID=1628085 RepID=A0AAW4W0Q7_9FIRM|nr:carbohydrate-binding domain-containing protein [Agathobaculum butyriciproducens]
MKKKLLAALLASALAAGMLPTSACAASSSYTTATATLVTLTDSSATAKGKYTGYEIDGTDVSITAAGTYVFSGDCDNGSITVKKGVTGVTIVLNGLTLTNDDSAAITLNKTAEASLIAAAGTTNTVADTEGSSDENAAVKVKSGAALAIGGTGALTVDGNAKNGIKGAADAVITVAEVKLNINAADDGLSCDDELNITGGTLSITAGGDAVKASPDTGDTENPDTTSLGNVTISGGTLTLNAIEDGIQADGDLTISGGTFDVTANGGHTTALTDDSASCKGFKAGKTLTVTGGTLTVDSADDALHAGTDVTISGGTLTLATGDDGVHANNDLVIGTKGASSTSTPRINITASYEGLEGTTVTVYGGDIDVAASDDGVNAASSTLGERSDKYAINIAGGDLYIDAGSDGLDSNNDISMTGGKVEVYGADALMDAAIDYDGTFTLSGGTLFGAGMEPSAGTQAYIAVGETSPSGGMGGGPNGQGGGQGMTPPGDANGNRPTPPNFSGNTSTDGTFTPPTKPSGGKANGKPSGNLPNRESALGIKEGSVITVQDSSGKTLCTATALGSMSSVIFSSADIKEGETYTVLVDGTSVGTAEAKLGTADSSSSMSTFKPGQGGQPNQNGSQATVGSFKDVPQNSWFASAVQYVTSNSLMNGTSTTAFSPSATMSRGMLMTVLARYAGESTEGGTVWYEKGMNWAKNKGISDGSAPNRNITREQLAAMLYRYAGEPDGAADLSAYADAGSVSAYAEKAVQWCVKNGILTGKTSSTLAPKATATRAECAAMLQRFASLTT